MTGPIANQLEIKSKSKKAIPKTWGRGPVRIYDIDLDCYILKDGTAIVSKRTMMKSIGRAWKGVSRTEMPNFVGAVNLQPFVQKNPELIEKLKGLDFYDGPNLIFGYHADIIPLVCNVYLEARQAGALTPSQLPVAQKCEILLRSFARVGIVAIIYEQLGYEKYKHPEALKILVESYLAEEVRKWSKEFPDELFFQMDRIYGNQKTTSRNRPKYYAKFIRKYIYDPIEKGLVLSELDQRNPINNKGLRRNRHHSHLNEEKGLPSLRAMIWQVVALLATSAGRPQFDRAYARLTGQSYQLSIFDEDN